MQNWYRLHHYPSDFLNLVYRYYAAHGIAYICTYYHFDIPDSITDVEVLDGSSYENLGDLSGKTWEKITLLPIYNTDEINIVFNADERGLTKSEQQTQFNFPGLYGIIPTCTDFVYFDEIVLHEELRPSTYPLFRVVNMERAINTYFDFWKLSLRVYHSTRDQLENQVRATYSFFDYEKKIYGIDEATSLYKALEKNENLTLSTYYKENIGFYFGV